MAMHPYQQHRLRRISFGVLLRRSALIAALALHVGLPTAACAQSLGAFPPNSVNRPIDPDATAHSRVVVSIRPVGKIPYDGLVLPIVSPDGRAIATQSGRAPSWNCLFADKGCPPPVGLALSAYSISIAPEPAASPDGSRDANKPDKPHSPRGLSAIKWNKPLLPGLLLGRAADEQGFLVEAPQPSGARWIGHVKWLTGEINWLVRDEQLRTVNAHAALADDGALVFVRRPLDRASFDLVLRTRRGDSSIDIVVAAPNGSESYTYPFISPDGTVVAAFAVPTDDLASGMVSLVAFARLDPTIGKSLSLVEISRLEIGRGGMQAAYQSSATMQLPAALAKSPRAAATSTTLNDVRAIFAAGLLFLSPRDGTTIWWEPRRSQVINFAPGSFAAAPFQHSDFGVLLAGDTDLTYQPLRKSKELPDGLATSRQVAVMAGRCIPRGTVLESGLSIVLTQPGSGSELAFNVILIEPAKAD